MCWRFCINPACTVINVGRDVIENFPCMESISFCGFRTCQPESRSERAVCAFHVCVTLHFHQWYVSFFTFILIMVRIGIPRCVLNCVRIKLTRTSTPRGNDVSSVSVIWENFHTESIRLNIKYHIADQKNNSKKYINFIGGYNYVYNVGGVG